MTTLETRINNSAADEPWRTTRVTVELTVPEAFQVVAAINNRLGYFEGTARDVLAARREQGMEHPEDWESTVATAIAQLRRAERALDAALMGTDE